MIEFDLSSDIQEAKRLGIISITILNEYSKFRDLLTYLSVLGFPVISSVGLWLLWANKERRSRLRVLFATGEEGGKKTSVLWLVAVMMVFLFISFDVNIIYSPYYNNYVGAWPFLAEEGADLAWAQSILSGEVYGKDFVCLYGPMLFYPLAWSMKVFGTTVVVERAYTYFLNLTAYGIIIVFFYKTLRFSFVLAAFIYLFFAPFASQLTPHFTYLRPVLGLLPILLSYLYTKTGNKNLLPAIGVVIGQSLLLSQEVGVCSLLSVTLFFLLTYLLGHSIKWIASKFMLILTGGIISISPMLFYFYSKDALSSLVASLYRYPKYVNLGFGAYPFPDFNNFITNPLSGELLYYWPIFVYAFTSIYLVTMIFMGSWSRDYLLKASLLLFGVLLFRYALGRSDALHLLNSYPPAILLSLLFIDGAIGNISKSYPNFKRGGSLLLLAGLCISILLLIVFTELKYGLLYLKNAVKHPNEKWSVIILKGKEIPELERGGVFFDYNMIPSITGVRKFLESNTKRGNYVYFFPNEAAYYFLFDRKNPTRYPISYHAATHEQREDVITDLEKNRPEYLVYSKKTWRIDNINETVQVPEIVEYLNRKYRTILDSEDILIAKRMEG